MLSFGCVSDSMQCLLHTYTAIGVLNNGTCYFVAVCFQEIVFEHILMVLVFSNVGLKLWFDFNVFLVSFQKARSDKETAVLKSKIQKLENLCRALQDERKKLAARIPS